MSDEELLASMLGGEWRRHPAHEDYFFSREGHAARITTRRGERKVALLKGCSAGRGYRAVGYPLGKRDGDARKFGRIYIHRGVCELFNGPCPDGMECRHLDGNKLNNRATNLAWGTPSENSADKALHGTMQFGESNPMAKLTSEKVQQMRLMRQQNNTPYYRLAEAFGVSTMTAFRATTGRAWK
jgi:HNH endonuclease